MTDIPSPLLVLCPTCQKQIPWDKAHPFRPFCGEKCKLIDLGIWANEGYCIAAPETDPLDEDAENTPQ